MQTLRKLPPIGLALSLTLALAACGTLGGINPDDHNQLTNHLENAASYYDRGHYQRAYQQWGRALDMEPDNVKGRLGRAMCLYQLGRAPTREGVTNLTRSEEQLTDLLDDDLEGQEWKALLGFGLVQSQWIALYDKKIAITEAKQRAEEEIDTLELEQNRRERSRRIGLAQEAFVDVLASDEQQLVDKLTCLLELARLCAFSRDYERSLSYCREYESQVERSKRFWRANMKRLPKEAPLYESKLKGAELQEGELRDLMGNVLFKLERFEEAEVELDRVIVIQPERASAYLNRGIIRQSRGDWDRARADFDSFLELTDLPYSDPARLEAAQRLDEVEKLVEAEDELRRRADASGE